MNASRWKMLICISIMIIPILLLSTLNISVAQTLENKLSLSPPFIYANLPTQVRASIYIYGAPSNVTLYDDDTQTLISNLYDNGTNGDIIAGDKIFSTELTLTKTQTGTLHYKVIADSQSSSIVDFEVKPDPNFQSLWASFVSALVNQDLVTALPFIKSEHRSGFQSMCLSFGLSAISAGYQTARDLTFIGSYGDRTEFNFTITTGGVNHTVQLIYHLDPDDVWRIETMDFLN